MPLLYSESERAFLCLQHEIIKKTNDRSIFLWTAIEKSHTSFCNLFARSAAEFALFDDYDLLTKYGRFEVTQSSLEINCPLIKVPRSSALEFFGVIIDAGKGYHCVCLQQIGQDKYAHVDADEISHILNPNYNPFAKNPRRQSQRIIIPHTIDNFTYECCIDSRLGGFHVEYCPIELQIHSVTPSYAWDEGTKTLKLDCSKSIELFEDKENSLKIVFSEISHPYTTFEVNLRNEMQSPVALRTIGRSSSNDIYGYVVRVTQRFIGDKMMNVVRIDYSINDEGIMTISSEKNPLPGHYTSYRNTSDEECARLIETWAREWEQENGKAMDSGSVVEEELSESGNDDVAHMPDILM